jgi:chromosome segregation ATPase/predicted small lipoprotein YifL
VKAALPLVLAGVLAALIGCGREGPKSAPPKPAAPGEREWSDDEMATDPEGYLKWADGQLASQIAQREERLTSLKGKRKEITERRNSFVGDYEAIANLESRLGTATRRADEEDRWPVALAGRTFSKEQADSILAEIKQFLAGRKDLASAYDGATAKLDAAEKSLREDVARLTTLREKVAADLIGYKADRANPEMEKLRKTEAEIAHYSRVLTSFADVNVQALPNPKQPISANLQSILK